MKLRLENFKNKYKHIAISSTRFASVNFSNESILKLILDKILFRKNFSIPLNINRFFKNKTIIITGYTRFKHLGFWQFIDTYREKKYGQKLLKEKKAPWKN